MALLTFAISVVGLRITTSLDTARRSDIWTRGILLAEMKMAELEARAVKFKRTDDELKGYFGIAYPGYSWRIRLKPTEIQDFFMITLEIGYNDDRQLIDQQKNDPNFEIDFENLGTKTVRTVYRLVPLPADFSLQDAAGLSFEDLQSGALATEGSGSGDGSGDQGGGSSELGNLWDLIATFLSEHPDILSDNGGIDLQVVASLPPEEFQMMMQLIQRFTGQGGNAGSVRQELDEHAQEQQQGQSPQGTNRNSPRTGR